MGNRVYLIFLSLVFLISCKKEQLTTLQIQVVSSVTQVPLGVASVAFYSKKVANNAVSNSFDLVKQGNTNGLGKFSVDITKTSSDVAYKFAVNQQHYLSKTLELNPDDIEASNLNELTCLLKPMGTLSFSIKSGINSSPNDELVFNFNNDEEVGESFSNLLFLGNQVDTILTTTIIAEQYNQFTYIIQRNGNYLHVKDSVFCPLGAVVEQPINY